MLEMQNCKRLPVIPALQTVTGITQSLVQHTVFADKDCTKQLATLTTDENGNTRCCRGKSRHSLYQEYPAPAGYKVDKTVYSLKVEAGKTATLKVSDTPKVTDTLIELFKIDMETQKDNPQGNASLAGAEFTMEVLCWLLQ